MQSDFTPSTSDTSSDTLEAEFCQIVSHRQLCSKADQKDCSDKRLASWMREWSGRLLDFLTGQQTLSIQQRSLPNGKVQWIVYDPDAESPRFFDSEQAVRVWVEQRYYQ